MKKGKSKTKKENKDDNPENAYQKLSFSSLSPIHEPLFSLLSESPVIYNSSANLKDKYTATLHKIVKNGQRILQGKISFACALKQLEKDTHSLNTHSTNTVFIDENFDASVTINDANFSVRDFMLEWG